MKFRKKCFSKHSKRRKSIEKYGAQAITLTSNKHKKQTSQSSHNQCVTIFLRRINPLNSKYNSSLNVHTFSLILIEKIMIWIDFWCWKMRKTTTETSLFALKITQKCTFISKFMLTERHGEQMKEVYKTWSKALLAT